MATQSASEKSPRGAIHSAIQPPGKSGSTMILSGSDRDRELPCVLHGVTHVLREECWSSMMRWRLHHDSPLHSGENWNAYVRAVEEKHSTPQNKNEESSGRVSAHVGMILQSDHTVFTLAGEVFWDDTYGDIYVPLRNACGKEITAVLPLESVRKIFAGISAGMKRERQEEAHLEPRQTDQDET